MEEIFRSQVGDVFLGKGPGVQDIAHRGQHQLASI